MKAFIKEWGLFIAIIIVALLTRIFVWDVVVVDGHSMDPTLADKERLIIVKTTKIERFDIVVAKETDNGSTKNIVKRVIGMPGDIIKFDKDQLTINGKKYNEPYLADFKSQLADGKLEKTYQAYPLTSSLSAADRNNFVDLAQNAQAFTTDTNTGNPTFQVTVPKGEYFLMGDNRIVSRDSRVVGAFTRSDIIGEAKLRIWPLTKIGLMK